MDAIFLLGRLDTKVQYLSTRRCQSLHVEVPEVPEVVDGRLDNQRDNTTSACPRLNMDATYPASMSMTLTGSGRINRAARTTRAQLDSLPRGGKVPTYLHTVLHTCIVRSIVTNTNNTWYLTKRQGRLSPIRGMIIIISLTIFRLGYNDSKYNSNLLWI